MAEHNLSVKDFVYCETCGCFVNLWKFDYNMEEAGHGDGCQTREVTEDELKKLITDCETPHAVCPKCGAIMDVTPDNVLGEILYCGFCQKEFTPDEARWENDFGECPGPKDLICVGCDHLTKVSGELTCSKEGPCAKQSSQPKNTP